jgi:hypothetical protein
MLNVPRLNPFNTCSLLLQTIGAFVQIQTLVHQLSSLNPQMANQDQALQVKSYAPRAHSVLPFLNPITNFLFPFLDRL